MTDPTSERLQEMMSKFGFTEKEARVAIHLEEAEKLLRELTREDNSMSGSSMPKLGSIVWIETHTREHFRALRRQLGVFVLRRDYPEGWGYTPVKDENEQD